MEHLIEAALELVFSFIKVSPKKRPDIELKTEFTVCYDKIKRFLHGIDENYKSLKKA